MPKVPVKPRPIRKAVTNPTSVGDISTKATANASKSSPTTVIPNRPELPTRDKDGYLCFPDYSHFKPNLTPQQVLEMGQFGGTYFRRIHSTVTGKDHENEWKDLPQEWFKNLSPKQYMSPTYDNSINRYKVSCGGDLDMWESSGWIKEIDPYGWFQWYSRFYLGRRCSDDERQIAR